MRANAAAGPRAKGGAARSVLTFAVQLASASRHIRSGSKLCENAKAIAPYPVRPKSGHVLVRVWVPVRMLPSIKKERGRE